MGERRIKYVNSSNPGGPPDVITKRFAKQIARMEKKDPESQKILHFLLQKYEKIVNFAFGNPSG